MTGQAIQMAELIDAQPKRNQHFGIEATGAARELARQMIELALAAQASEHEFGRQIQVAAVQRGGQGRQEIGGKAATVHLHQDFEGGLAGRGNGHSLDYGASRADRDIINPLVGQPLRYCRVGLPVVWCRNLQGLGRLMPLAGTAAQPVLL